MSFLLLTTYFSLNFESSDSVLKLTSTKRVVMSALFYVNCLLFTETGISTFAFVLARRRQIVNATNGTLPQLTNAINEHPIDTLEAGKEQLITSLQSYI